MGKGGSKGKEEEKEELEEGRGSARQETTSLSLFVFFQTVESIGLSRTLKTTSFKGRKVLTKKNIT